MVHSAKGLILDATSFVRIIPAIIFIILDGKIKTHILYNCNKDTVTERKGLSRIVNEELNIEDFKFKDVLDNQPPLDFSII